MELTIVKTAVSKAKPVLFVIRKHLPEILVGTGVASVAGGTVLACKATMEANRILNAELIRPREETEEGLDEDGNMTVTTYTEFLEFSDLERSEAIRLGIKAAKPFVPAVGLIAGGVGMLVGAKHIEHARFTAALGAYSAMQSMFEEYRANVERELGADADRKFLNGAEMTEYEVEEPPEEGKRKPKKVKEKILSYSAENPYHRVFDECNSPTEWQDNMEANRFFLECQQTVLNQELNREGRIFLNDVYKRLGFDYCEIGQFVGWLASDIEGSKDGFIDFGIDYACMRREVEQVQYEGRRPEPSIWLTFNCDGEVWDKPLKKKREDI